jgi:hypothetical protein
MTISQKDIKLLWGRSGNRCAVCRIELSQDGDSLDSAFTLGEQAHIVGESEIAARGNSPLSSEERESYDNRILLCPNHHTEIDKNKDAFPIERLYFLKSNHELWVRETLADSPDLKTLAGQVVVTSIIDAAVEMCHLKDWGLWTSHALAADPSWDVDFTNSIYEFRKRVAAAVWPEGFDELKRATTTLSIQLHRAKEKFREHAEREDTTYIAIKFYKEGGYNPNFDSDLFIYEQWLDECFALVYHAVRSANWFADIVRRDINPMFFAESGKFVIEEGPFWPDFSYKARVIEYSEDEKRVLPSSLYPESAKNKS